MLRARGHTRSEFVEGGGEGVVFNHAGEAGECDWDGDEGGVRGSLGAASLLALANPVICERNYLADGSRNGSSGFPTQDSRQFRDNFRLFPFHCSPHIVSGGVRLKRI